MNQDKSSTRSPPARSPCACTTSSTLLASFSELPSTVQKMMEQRGVTIPKELRTSAAFSRLLEQNFEPVALKAITEPKGDPLKVLSAVQDQLKSRSSEALAIHLYIRELLKLLSVAAARQYLTAARNR